MNRKSYSKEGMKYDYFVVEGFSHGTVYSNTKFINCWSQIRGGDTYKRVKYLKSWYSCGGFVVPQSLKDLFWTPNYLDVPSNFKIIDNQLYLNISRKVKEFNFYLDPIEAPLKVDDLTDIDLVKIKRHFNFKMSITKNFEIFDHYDDRYKGGRIYGSSYRIGWLHRKFIWMSLEDGQLIEFIDLGDMLQPYREGLIKNPDSFVDPSYYEDLIWTVFKNKRLSILERKAYIIEGFESPKNFYERNSEHFVDPYDSVFSMYAKLD